MADNLPPSGHRYPTRRNSRKRSFEETPREPEAECVEKPEDEGASSSRPGEIDCAICLQSCVHPTRLPCGHIFCFLCMKGVFWASAKCAMCRRPIPRAFLETPDLLEVPTPSATAAGEEDAYHWFYEGRHGGWWQYEERMSCDIEEHHKSGTEKFETIICGHLYTIDLKNKVQYRNDTPSVIRKIVRDRPSRLQKRGVAGLK